MDRLMLSLQVARKALTSLQELLVIAHPSTIERDASIQRFEYTFEAVWKAAKHYLRENEGLDLASPKSIVRSCREVGLINVAQATKALEMTDDRNLTSHTYNETLAVKIHSRLPEYAQVMNSWLISMEK